MQLERQKKYKGVQLLKLEPQFFGNAKRYSMKKSSNEQSSIYNQSTINFIKSLRAIPDRHPFKFEEEKKTGINSYINKKNIKKINSYNKCNINHLSEFLFLKKKYKKKEEKKETDKILSKFKKGSQKKVQSLSCKDVCSLKNNLLSKKSQIINNINIIKNNINDNKITNSKTKSGSNDMPKENNINNNEKIINDYKSININTIKNNTENVTNNEDIIDSNKNNINNNNSKKKNTIKKLFCCL
jgi:hypothetical protein